MIIYNKMQRKFRLYDTICNQTTLLITTYLIASKDAILLERYESVGMMVNKCFQKWTRYQQ